MKVSSLRPASVVVAFIITTTSDAFTPSHLSALTTLTPFTRALSSSQSSRPSQLYALPGGGSEIQPFLDHLHSSSALIADAATAAVDASAEAVSSDGGWWESYLNVFKSCLIAVHATIDQPLRDAGFTQTWGPSIFLFTAGVRSLLLPLSVQQTKSSEYIKALKPYQDEIKKKFKDNKDMINRATAKLFEDANTNPLAGCLISLLQLPIFLGLYRSVTLLAKDGQLQEPFLWIPSLQGPVTGPTFRGMEWLTEGWTSTGGAIPVPQLGWETTLSFLVMPIVLVLGQSLSMSVLTPPPDENMSEEEREQFERSQGILKFLPLMIGYFALQVPAGLTIYFFTSNCFTLLQSVAVRQYYKINPPKIELPDYWDALDDVANMSPDERRKAASAGMAVGPKWEDLVDEANFHFVVERTPLREDSAAWDRIKGDELKVPEEMASWVNGGSNLVANGSSNSTQEMEPTKV